jgi:hypothetical protein
MAITKGLVVLKQAPVAETFLVSSMVVPLRTL